MPDPAARGIYYGEGPRWHDGRLRFSDFFGRCVHALAPDGDDEVVLRIDGQPSGRGCLRPGPVRRRDRGGGAVQPALPRLRARRAGRADP
ncbi:MAG TPA: hypothetical protein VFX25_38995 [Streptosporangiaceae bacterium]|nr:hypothetical protein [Streptosporangiaceae bacterium]